MIIYNFFNSNSNKKYSLYIFLFITLFSHSVISDTPQKMSFVRIQDMAGQEVGGRILLDVYERLGIPAEVIPMPGKRALREAISGRKDGESVRIYAVGEKYPDLIRVPTPLFDFLTMGFAQKGTDITLEQPKDLENYVIVRTSGVQHTKNMTEGMDNIHIVESSDLLMPFVSHSRADIALTGRLNGLILLKKGKINNVEEVGQPLQVNPLYHYLNKRHAHLVPKVDAVIREMRESGEIAKLKAQYEQEYLDAIVTP